jgi:AcrR family transcriptional regulator
MPKSFSESERAWLKERLIDEAQACLALFGIRRTTVDELCRRVNIPKGTFYLFYASKELLFFDVFCALHDAFQHKLLADIAVLDQGVDADTLTDIISYLLTLATSGELELLFRKLPPALSKQHAEQDDFRVDELVSRVPGMKKENVRIYSAALRGIFITLLHKKEVGEDVFDEALRIMIRGVVSQMFAGQKP